jgi:hypothetical protein
METPTIEDPIVITKDRSGSKYDVPEVRQYIRIKRDDGLSWSQIADGLKERGFDKISPTVCMNLYTTMIARSTVTHNAAKEVFDDFTEELKLSYGEAIKIIGEYIRTMRDIIEEMKKIKNEDGDIDLLKAKMAIAKTIPTGVSILKEIREFVRFQAELQDKKVTEGTKQIEMTASETMDFLNKYQQDIIKEKISEIAKAVAKELELNDTYVPKIKNTIQKITK